MAADVAEVIRHFATGPLYTQPCAEPTGWLVDSAGPAQQLDADHACAARRPRWFDAPFLLSQRMPALSYSPEAAIVVI